MSNSVFKFLNKDKNRCEFKGKEFDISTYPETKEKYFIYEDSEYYFIIENEEQAIKRVEQKNQEIDFQRCIFIYKDIALFNDEIKQVINFRGAVFCEEVNFCKIKFSSIILRETLFEKQMFFLNSCFSGILKFNRSKFKNEVNFVNCHFYENIEATGIASEKDFVFWDCTFEKDIDFSLSILKEELSFNGNNKYNSNINLCLSNITIKNLKLGKMNKNNSFLISLADSNIKNINYLNTDFTKENVKDRETFLKLKQEAIKKHDHINALNFYKNEMILHSKELEKKKTLDFWILKFEEFISDFGTNPIKPIFFIICISFAFSLFVSFFTNSCNVYIENSLLLINPTLSIKNILSITLANEEVCIPPLLEVFNFLKNILHGILIYETIKSFRKFSRKL